MTRNTAGAVHISVRGVVQGVGFRPFVYLQANKYALSGWVRNTAADVQIELEGNPDNIAGFLKALREHPPPMSRIESVELTDRPPRHVSGFEIRLSDTGEGQYQLVSPDLATCSDCRKEIFAPPDRRYRYAFTNCTQCGPRFTIIESMPYDRPSTTMRQFEMCSACRAEYDNPENRRFHAQPNACPVCGPELALRDSRGQPVPCDDAIATTAALLGEGSIVAIKGLGGFLLACDAESDEAVNILRRRKKRPAKPLAVMLPDIKSVNEYCYVNNAETDLLESPAGPIVLLRRKESSGISPLVAPGLCYLGVMLPYTPR